MNYIGDFIASSTVTFAITTNAATGASVAPSSAFEAADLIIYKGSSATQRTSAAGVTMTSPFDSITGLHMVSIDTSDNTDAGFWAIGSDYHIVLSPDTETVDGQTVVAEVAHFSIQNRLNTSNLTLPVGGCPIAGILDSGTLQSATGTTAVLRSAASFADSRLIGAVIAITGGTGAGQARVITAYTNSSDTATVDTWTTTPDNTSTYVVYYGSPASATALPPVNATQLAGQTITAAAGVTFPTSVASPTNITAGTITTTTNLTNAPTAGDFTATMKTSIGTAVAASAVASVTGNVGGNVTGSVGSLAAQAKTDVSTAVLTTQMTESYAADGVAPTLAQATFLTMQGIMEYAVVSTTLTVKKLDGSTTAATCTLNDGTSPTSRTRAT
jgi:hypothetical protein